MSPQPMPTSGRFQDLTGKTFGRWTVLSFGGCDSRHHSLWLCRCECGAEQSTRGTYLLRGQSRSCGRCVANMGTSDYDNRVKSRLLASVKRMPSGCWEWQNRREKNGYGRTSYRRRKIGSHVLSYRLHRGDVAPGLFVCHTCDNRPCCNPDHLFLGTHQDNVADMVAKGRQFHPIGERHTQSRLTTSAVIVIRDLCISSSLTQNEIAGLFGVSRTAISAIATGKNWKHLLPTNVIR